MQVTPISKVSKCLIFCDKSVVAVVVVDDDLEDDDDVDNNGCVLF